MILNCSIIERPKETIISYTIDDLAHADTKFREASAVLEEELRRQLDEKLAELRNERDKIAFRLYQQGVPKRQIYLNGLHTKAAITANEAIQRGAELCGESLTTTKATSKAKRRLDTTLDWRKKGEIITATLSDADYQKAQAEGGMEETREGIFFIKDGYIEPHTNDMAIPAVWLFYRSMDFQMRLKEFAGVD